MTDQTPTKAHENTIKSIYAIAMAPTDTKVMDTSWGEKDFEKWLAEHDKQVIAKAFIEWADFQVDGLRFGPSDDEDWEETKRWTDAVKYWVQTHILKESE